VTFEEQLLRWEARVAALGWRRAVMNVADDPAKHQARTDAHLKFLEPHLRAALQPGDRLLLDYGCGWGRLTPYLAEIMFDHDPTGGAMGVEPTASLLEKAREVSRTPNVYYERLGKDGTIPIPVNGVDVVFAYMVFSAIIDPVMLAIALMELRRVLKPGGLVCIIDNTSRSDGRPVRSPYSISRTVEEYQDLFSEAFGAPIPAVDEYVELREVNHLFLGRAL